MKVIKLKEPAKCADCGRDLPTGTRAKYYGEGKIYCADGEGHNAPADPQAGSGPAAPDTAPAAASRETTAREAAVARAPVSRAELAHLLEGVRFVIDSVLDQLKRE